MSNKYFIVRKNFIIYNYENRFMKTDLLPGDIIYLLKDCLCKLLTNYKTAKYVIAYNASSSMLEKLISCELIEELLVGPIAETIKCECGAEKANTTHSNWCPEQNEKAIQ